MDTTYTKFDVESFAGTMRRYGYTGDIVLATIPGSRPGFLQKIRYTDACMYIFRVR